ncbi:membrane protein, putative [Altererythrobacter epoxidivorans]|uniref:Membrane protein, putative n=1 Tax=Altererythrobacter epoxidivorans TaxID=361183 RepID=A0A0M4M602_9SPHN|nr:membrane protein, putative [Altererythrobacter epoxidivorans]
MVARIVIAKPQVDRLSAPILAARHGPRNPAFANRLVTA